ncbi:MAG: phospholipase D-like domain-containing protein [Synergistaceae bacterium]|jgi:superfamily II DNA or RNA helicase|nr:phospholipase D-like domain-containing protein [Synergistaceae bacterium]
MLNRYSSRTHKLSEQFINAKLAGAVSYDRIAGYFCSSILEVAGEAIEAVSGKVRVICNSGLSPEDVRVAGLAKIRMRQEWNEYKPEEVFATAGAISRLSRLYSLLSSGKLEVRVLPDEIYGLMHGKAGVITYADGLSASFLGSVNETKSAYTTNYEMVWEDDSAESVAWIQEEFDYFWNDKNAVPLSDFIIADIDRVSKRKLTTLKDWRELSKDDDAVPSVAAEEPIFRNEFGLWAHQKYFVVRAFEEHKQRGGARLLLADQVGLGKTVQLAMAAKLMALYGDKPILIIVPKTLLFQWQDELKTLLDMPSAVWLGRYWVDENGIEYPSESIRSILKCPRKVGIVSQGLITGKSESAELLKQMKFDCVILDEAHRARRKNLANDPDSPHPQTNNLLTFMNEITFQTTSMLLATATPIQIDPIEAFDLLKILSLPKDASRILGDKYSVWNSLPRQMIKMIQGHEEQSPTESWIWQVIRNPFPPRGEGNRRIGTLRDQLDIDDAEYILDQKLYDSLSAPQKTKIKELYNDGNFIQNHNPYVRTIIRRTREFLENTINDETGEPYLKKIEAKLFGENEDEALELTGYLAQAYSIAEKFCDMLSGRVKGGGFMSTLLLKRIGSAMVAGESTAKKMLAWTEEGYEKLRSLYDEIGGEDDGGNQEESPESEIKDLTGEEIECLEQLVAVLKANHDTDPKYNRALDILKNGVGGGGAWKEKGCILFSQYFDSARYVAELLSRDLPETLIGLYAGGDKSGIYSNGVFSKESKERLKNRVRTREVRVLVGTDAASEGLNLQSLGSLINIDLPWNPTRLEQRKGRIQRIGQLADAIFIYNMRYKDSVEDRVHRKLSDRLREIFTLFGQIPDVLEDVWIAMAQKDEERAIQAINKIPRENPFIIKYEKAIPDYGDWEKCAVVLDKEEKLRELLKGW